MTGEKRWEFVQQALLPGERVLWWDKPLPLSRRPRGLAYMGVSVFTAAFFLLLFMSWRQRPPDEVDQVPVQIIVMILFGLVVLAPTIVMVPREVLQIRRTAYVVTDRRVIIVDGPRSDSRWINEVVPDMLVESGGQGTLCFDPEAVLQRHGSQYVRLPKGFRFEAITNPNEVAALIRSVQNPARADGAVPATTTAGMTIHPPPPPPANDQGWTAFFDRMLLPGEEVLWFGRRRPLPRWRLVLPLLGVVWFPVLWVLLARSGVSVNPFGIALLSAIYLGAIYLAWIRPTIHRQTNVVYVVTDARAIIFDGVKLESLALARVSPTMSAGRGTIGTLHFTSGVLGAEGYLEMPFEFVDIPDVVDVANLIRRAQSQPAAQAPVAAYAQSDPPFQGMPL